MDIAVIGTGWLGHPLATALTAAGHITYGSRRSVSGAEHVLYRTFLYPSANPRNHEILKKADVVVLAFPPDRTNSEQYANDCLEVCRQLDENCRVVLTSSTSVYPDGSETCRETAFSEVAFSEHPVQRAEYELIRYLNSRLTIVRLAGLVGPDRWPAHRMSKSGKTYPGNEPVNVIHQTDAVNLVLFLIENDVRGEIVNGCAREHPQREAYYSWMAPEIGVAPPRFENGGSGGKIISSEKSRELGYQYVYDNPFDFLNGGTM